MIRISHLFTIVMVAALLCGCNQVKDIAYFQDMKAGMEQRLVDNQYVRVQPMDKLRITVNSRDDRVTAMFNLRFPTGQTTSGSNQSNPGLSILLYTVDDQGEIDFPEIGKIMVGGKRRTEIAADIKKRLLGANLLKDCTVTCEFASLSYSVLGEVKTAGRYDIDRDRISVLDALARAGDLTIYGNRTNVMVLRDMNGVRKTYVMDLTSGESVMTSPAFYLQQDDVIFVEPNKKRSRESTVNGNTLSSTSFWFSCASLLTTVVSLIIALTK